MNSKSSSKCEKEKKSPSMIFTCSLCNYSTDKSANLSRHYKTMHEAMKTLVQCCGLSFSNKSDYRHHNKVSHANGHSCLVCHRNFSRRALLRRHLSVHTGFREFQCPFIKCNYGSSHKSNLTRHMRIHGLNTSLKARVLEKQQNQLQTQQQKQIFQPDSTTKASPLKNMKTPCSSHLSPTHDANNNAAAATSQKNNATTTTTTSATITCSTQSQEGFNVLLKSKLTSSNAEKIRRKPKPKATATTTTTTTKKRIGPKASKLSHSIEAILSRKDRIQQKQSKFKFDVMSGPVVLENAKMNVDEVTSTTFPLFSPNCTSEGQIEQQKAQGQQCHSGNLASYYMDYFNKNKNHHNTDMIQSQHGHEASKSFQTTHNIYNRNNEHDTNNNYYYTSPQYHHLPLINHTNNNAATPATTTTPAICSSCDYLTPIYNSSSSLPIPMSSILPSQQSSPSLSSYVRPHEVYSNNNSSAFHSTFGDFNPSVTQLRTNNGHKSGQDSRILPIFHSPYAVPIPLPSSTSCYYYHQSFQPQVLVPDSFSPSISSIPPLTLAPTTPAPTLTSTATTYYNSHQNHPHLSSPGPSSSDSYNSNSNATLMSFARVSNYQPIEFVSY